MTCGAALGCWLLAGWTLDLRPVSAPGASVDPSNPLGLCASPYGALIAGLVKSSLHTYWHGGDDAHHDSDHAARRPTRLNRLAPRTAAAAPPETQTTRPASWLENCARGVSELEARRTRRNSPFALSPAHRRFLDAAARWRLRAASALDPGDPALYEILHYLIETSATSPQHARERCQTLADRTVALALSSQASPANALAGAGAMLDVLNDALQPGRIAAADPAALLRDWELHRRCLSRHRALLRAAQDEGWWSAVPENRRHELELHAALIEKLSAETRELLLRRGVDAPPVSPT